jgi:AraC-like DNA-binding protein/anti-sigma regulatory factor (Ser/Thr protein kinase)/catechol 2,3-dioxygenase-like lactoylglutathione lyase family enzyme
MADPHRVELRPVRSTIGFTVVSAHGRVTPSTMRELRDDLAKLLADGVPVLLDVADLHLDWAPAPEVFVSAVTAAGGWPLARLVLFSGDGHTVERLQACRVPDSVPLARTVDAATALVGTRPAQLSCSADLPPVPSSVRRARQFLRDACARWGVAERDDMAVVVTELVTNAVEHAGTPLRLRLVLDRSVLRVSVRDRRPGPLPDPAEPNGPRGHGLRAVARLSRTWGVLLDGDGKAVWAHVPLVRGRSVTRAGDVDRTPGSPREPADGTATAVTALRRRRFATADPEHAHAFLRSVLGEHTLRLSGAEQAPGSHLEYDGADTNLFAVERIAHGAAVEALFPPAEAVVVAHPLDGGLRVTARREELRAGPGDVVLWGPGADVLVGSSRLDAEVVRLAPATVRRVTAELTGLDLPVVPFDLSHPVSPARAALWRSTVAHLRRDVLGDDEVMASPLSRATVLRSLVAVLVETFPHPALAALAGAPGERGPVTPRTVRRAVRFIEERAGDDIGLADIASAAGIGARGLQLAFRRHADVTPLEYLRRVRLERAHRDLTAADPAEATVGAIATRWGFPHHGNFSALYLRTYGRSPSMTLRS